MSTSSISHFAAHYNTSLNPNPYSNALHDSVWATVIALNTSLQKNNIIGTADINEIANNESCQMCHSLVLLEM